MRSPAGTIAAAAGLRVQATATHQHQDKHRSQNYEAYLSYYFNDHDDPYNALGISILQDHHRIRSQLRSEYFSDSEDGLSNSNLTPRPTNFNNDDEVSPAPIEPPPRNPRRLLSNHQYPRESSWLPDALCIYHEPEAIPGPETNSPSGGDGYYSFSSSISTLASSLTDGRGQALEQISPPSSPEISPRRDNHAGDVSPIDDGTKSHQFLNHDSQVQSQTYQNPSSNPTSHEHYQYQTYQPPAQRFSQSFNAPANQSPPHGSLPRSSRFRLSSFGDGTSNSLGQRMRSLGKSRAEPSNSLPQPADQADHRFGAAPLSLAALKIPRRSSRRVSHLGAPLIISTPLEPISSASDLEIHASGAPDSDRGHLPSKVARKPVGVSTPPSKRQSTTPTSSGSKAPPTPPLDHHTSSFNTTAPSARASSPLDSDFTPSFANTNTIRRKPTRSHRGDLSGFPNPLGSSPVYIDAANRRDYDASPLLRLPQKLSKADEAWTQPPSRFSITTYATSNPGTPQQASEEPLTDNAPSPGPARARETSSPTYDGIDTGRRGSISVLKRKPFNSSPYVANNKTATQSDTSIDQYNNSLDVGNLESTRRASIMSTSKPLPPPPQEFLSSDDRISQLNAILSSLAHRRANIHKSIKQITELMPKDNILASEVVLQKREVEKQKVEGLKQELAEIQREEYEFGIKLHRAYKRLDNNAEFEHTTLWVQRMTS